MSNEPSCYYEVVSQYKRIQSQVIDAVGHVGPTAEQVAEVCVPLVLRSLAIKSSHVHAGQAASGEALQENFTLYHLPIKDLDRDVFV